MKNNLRVILADKKITATKIHEDTGISKTTISGIVNERTDPNLSTLIKLADYLDVKLDVLVAREHFTTKQEIDERLISIQGAIEDAMKRNKKAQK